ncbi:MAG: hypothetical protein DWQ35_13730 [Planctomycetota bacterium]|nr:MAG: hypothetical protein DWQ35_13730 [Planctomycetota bacterium]REK25996.1 MAG: hypothetical protein DWQ42_10230 [Planctomycetota bacterium]REK46889.1 MAG: hypothetical protein DWQ46_05175 [Planctomycetota bacterium]
MDQEFILRKIAEVMNWDDASATTEFARIRLMSRIKYDGYQDFLAGARFAERLLDWLQQFPPNRRDAAYGFIRDRLVYISAAEMDHLVELFFFENVVPRLVRAVADSRRVPSYAIWGDEDAKREFRKLLRKSLFIELSDGARIGTFRRANAGWIDNEQVVTAPRINEDKWGELLEDLRESVGDENARFEFIFLMDDFTASGTSLLRKPEKAWKGKLFRFRKDVSNVLATHFADPVTIHVHHYLATEQARDSIDARNAQITDELKDDWFSSVEFSYGHVLVDGAIDLVTDAEFIEIVDEHYDTSIDKKFKRHIEQSGVDTMKYGYGGCRLPIILDHNAPNNSFPILWAESPGGDGGPPMRALFRRRQRHT